MIETVISGAILATLSGLAFLAYNHPDVYAKIYIPLMVIPWLGTIGILIWFGGASDAYVTFLPFMKPDTSNVALHALDPIRQTLWWCLGGATAFGIYAPTLRALADLGVVSRDNRDRQPKKDGGANPDDGTG